MGTGDGKESPFPRLSLLPAFPQKTILDKARFFSYSKYIAFASVKGRAFKEVRGHKSGPVLHCSGPSMLDFTLADGTRKSFAGGSVFHSGLGYVVNNERHAT